MSISAAVAIAIAIGTAMCLVVLGVVIHHGFTQEEATFDSNGMPSTAQPTWTPNHYSQEQLERMDYVRWKNRKDLWEIARQDRLDRGIMEPPDWYPGDVWTYQSAGTRYPRPETRASPSASRRNPPQNFSVAEQDIVNNPDNIERAYRAPRATATAEDSPESDNEFVVPTRSTTTPAVQRELPPGLRRWTQHGPPLQSPYTEEVPRIIVNDEAIELNEYNSFSNQPHRAGPFVFRRSSSHYSDDVLGTVPPTPPRAYLSSLESLARDNERSVAERDQRSRVLRIIEQWETANGSISHSGNLRRRGG